MNETTRIWQEKLQQCLLTGSKASPRGMEVLEVLGGRYVLEMPAYLNIAERGLNLAFMLAEPAWILSGSNRLSDIELYMKAYGNYSDDHTFLRGAYGPKVVDQLPYVVDAIAGDVDTRQAVVDIWRERPGKSKDIPCTLSMQFFVRDKKLHTVVTMRSQDIVYGFTYDVFTFSVISLAVKLLLMKQGTHVGLGQLFVNVGSLHLYEKHYEDAKKWLEGEITDLDISERVDQVLGNSLSYEDLIGSLYGEAEIARRSF